MSSESSKKVRGNVKYDTPDVEPRSAKDLMAKIGLKSEKSFSLKRQKGIVVYIPGGYYETMDLIDVLLRFFRLKNPTSRVDFDVESRLTGDNDVKKQ